jgi:hypothetical protein
MRLGSWGAGTGGVVIRLTAFMVSTGLSASALRLFRPRFEGGGGDPLALDLVVPGSLCTRLMWSRRFQWRGKPLPGAARSQPS